MNNASRSIGSAHPHCALLSSRWPIKVQQKENESQHILSQVAEFNHLQNMQSPPAETTKAVQSETTEAVQSETTETSKSEIVKSLQSQTAEAIK